MRGDVLPASLEVVTELGHCVERVLDLLVRVESAIQHAVVDRVRVALDVGDERHDGGFQLVEDRFQLIRGEAGLGAVQQRVVRPLLVAERLGNSLVELDVLFQVWSKELEVGLATRPLPVGPRRRGGMRDFRDELGRKLRTRLASSESKGRPDTAPSASSSSLPTSSDVKRRCASSLSVDACSARFSTPPGGM